MYIDDFPQYERALDANPRFHTIEIYGLNSKNVSKAIIDVYKNKIIYF